MRHKFTSNNVAENPQNPKHASTSWLRNEDTNKNEPAHRKAMHRRKKESAHTNKTKQNRDYVHQKTWNPKRMKCTTSGLFYKRSWMQSPILPIVETKDGLLIISSSWNKFIHSWQYNGILSLHHHMNEIVAMNGENRELVTDWPNGIETWPIEIEYLRKFFQLKN
jgi:hypothetical protein